MKTIDDGRGETVAHADDTLAHTTGSGGGVRVDGAQVPVTSDVTRYEQLDLLGEGGMGKVWLLRDQRIGRRVAKKELLRGDDVSAEGRFLREARMQGQLEHPAVVPVYDLARGEDGRLFFTMKRVRGVTLADVIDRRADGDAPTLEKFSQRRLVSAIAQVCLAVEFAHERGVIHRDLKPDNLMLGDHGEIYVLDWGVARLLREDDHELDEETHPVRLIAEEVNATGLIGTPGYIAPELLRGGKIGPRSDVFSLGAILFEVLVHRPLFGHGSSMDRLARTMEEIDVAALIAEHDREAPPELVALCARATARDPDKRIASCRELSVAIESWLDGQRDLELRRQLAERHLAEAREANAGTDLASRKRALRAVGRALAIKPDHPEARALGLALFSSPPTEAPPEVEAKIDDARSAQGRITAKGGALGMISMLGFLPVLALLGVRNWAMVTVFAVATVIAIVISTLAARRKQRSDMLLYASVAANNVVFALCAGFYGPLVMVPTMVITNTVSFALHLEPRTRAWAVATACLAVGVPVGLQLAGILPASYVGTSHGLVIVPHWLALPPTWTVLFIALGTLIAIVNGARAVAQIRDELTLAERRLQIQAWQLQQLLPEEPAG